MSGVTIQLTPKPINTTATMRITMRPTAGFRKLHNVTQPTRTPRKRPRKKPGPVNRLSGTFILRERAVLVGLPECPSPILVRAAGFRFHRNDPSLRETGLVQFESFELLPVGFPLDFPGDRFQLAQPAEA